jgi:hypothetical protein
MNTQKLRSKRVVIPTAIAAAVLSVGGVAWGNSDSGSDELKGDDLDRATRAALDAVGGGEVTGTEVDDEEGAYEIEVTKADGSQVDVHLDENFKVISQDPDDETEDDADDDAEDAQENDDD